LFVAGGGGPALLGVGGKSPLIVTVAAAKMNAPALELVARAILCNWLVCLAIWTSARMTNDTPNASRSSGASTPLSRAALSIRSPT